MSSCKEYTKKDARIQIKQEIKLKEICGNFFLWSYHARSILKKTQEFESKKKLNQNEFVETSFFDVIIQGVYHKKTRNNINREL